MKRNHLLSLLILFVWLPSLGQVFYRVERPDLPAPSYLFGTHHLAPAAFLSQFKDLPEAMEKTMAVVGEIDMLQDQMAIAMKMQPYMAAPSDSTLSSLYTTEEFAVLNEKFKRYSPIPGLDLSAFNTMRPMVVTNMVSVGQIQESIPDYNPAEQLDLLFQQKYREADKKNIPLETPEQQGELLFTFIPVKVQAETLKELLLDDSGKLQRQIKKLNDAYFSQDLKELERITHEEEDDSGFMEALTTVRNHDWMTRLPGIMTEQPAMIVVGALHLAGEEGLVNLLRQEGYTVTPLH
ncbi:MAG: TraB/GumN family protein [Bacteroides sp.]|nr:TraB/GumN family protein [Bacteroides sp.]